MKKEFEQREKESAKAYAAFNAYIGLGAERSLEAVRLKLGKCKALIEKWSVRHRWVERTEIYDRHLAKVELQATEAVVRGKSAEWLTRQEKLREAEWEMHEKCVAAARKSLATFLKKDNVYANLSDIARILEIASKLGRLASGMATDKTELTGEDGAPIKVELEVALKKIYGVAAPPANVEEAPAKVLDAEVIKD